MSKSRTARIGLAAILVGLSVAGGFVAFRSTTAMGRTHVTAYFENSNGVFVGDEVRILGVPVGKIDTIEPQPTRVRVTFWFDDEHQVPADAKAVILSPTLVTARAVELTPAYTNGPTLHDDAVIAQDHTAVPMEWDDFRTQLQKLTDTLQPTEPGGVSTLGAFVSTAADNLRGQGANIRDAITKLSQSISALGDHSQDIFGSVKNLSILVSALQDSTVLLGQLNENFASVTGLLANDPNEVANAVKDLNDVADEVTAFVADNREALGTTSDKVASVSQTLVDNLDDIEQLLHISPTTLANNVNTYQPAQGSLSGALAAANFANPITFICGAIQAASRLGADQSSKLCVQYLAPIVKNRQMNFPPLGENLFVGTSARPNELTYSEDWMRPDYVPPQPPAPSDGTPPPSDAPPAAAGAPLAAEAPTPDPDTSPARATDPTAGLPGLMMPPGGGS